MKDLGTATIKINGDEFLNVYKSIIDILEDSTKFICLDESAINDIQRIIMDSMTIKKK